MALIQCTECGKEISSKADKCPHCGCPIAAKALKNSNYTRLVILLALLGLVGYFALTRTIGTENTNKLVAVATRSPMTLLNQIENIPANSWKAIGVTLPYNGSLQIEITVQKGNEQEVRLIPVSEIENYKSNGTYSQFDNFMSESSTTYIRNGNLNAGQYYLVLKDKTLGILSASSSDIKVFAKLNP